MSATSGSDEPIVDGTVMVTSADRETTVLLLPVMVVWHAEVARGVRLRSARTIRSLPSEVCVGRFPAR